MRQKYILYPFATAGDQSVIPDPTQVSGSVSFQQGYGFDYERDLASDPLALPVDRAAMNWLFLAITQAIQAQQQFFAPEWITTANNGGAPFAYDYGAIVRYSASGLPPFVTYQSIVAGAGTNTSVPGADANWRVLAAAPFYQAAGIPTGAINGANTSFVLPQVPIGSVAIFINTGLATLGVDYTLATALGVTTITTLGTPLGTGGASDTISFTEYRY